MNSMSDSIVEKMGQLVFGGGQNADELVAIVKMGKELVKKQNELVEKKKKSLKLKIQNRKLKQQLIQTKIARHQTKVRKHQNPEFVTNRYFTPQEPSKHFGFNFTTTGVATKKEDDTKIYQMVDSSVNVNPNPKKGNEVIDSATSFAANRTLE